MSKPKPLFEDQILVWRWEFMTETSFNYKDPSHVDKDNHKRIEEKYQAQRFCRDGDLHWVKLYDYELEEAKEKEIIALAKRGLG